MPLSTAPRPPPPPTGTPPRLAIAMSALVWPGVGQLMQRRWIAAALFLVAFTVATIWMIVEFVRILVTYYNLADFSQPAQASPGWYRLVAAFAASMILWAVSLGDTCWAHQRALRRRQSDRQPAAR